MLGVAAWLPAGFPALAGLSAQAVPIKYNLTVRSGESVARDVLVSNLGDAPVVVRVRLADWELDQRGDMNLLPAGTTARTLKGAATFEPEEFSLQPGQSGRVHVTLALPAAGPATCWGVMLSEVRPASAAAPRLGPRAIAQLGTTIYLSRVPEHDIRPEVTGMQVLLYGTDSLRVTLRVRNVGERHFYVSGDMALSGAGGKHLSDGTVGRGVVLPEGERRFTWTSPVPPAAGRYTATASLDTGEPELLVAEVAFDWPWRSPLPVAGDWPH